MVCSIGNQSCTYLGFPAEKECGTESEIAGQLQLTELHLQVQQPYPQLFVGPTCVSRVRSDLDMPRGAGTGQHYVFVFVRQLIVCIRLTSRRFSGKPQSGAVSFAHAGRVQK